MIFDQLTLNKVQEIETRNIGDLSSVAAVYVETSFNMRDSGGINLISLREELKEKAIDYFVNFYSNLNKPIKFFNLETVPGVELLPNGSTIDLERVEFINQGEEECEEVYFKKIFFIPLSKLREPSVGTLPATTGRSPAAPNLIESSEKVKVCNLPDFRAKVKFIQTFMKINFLSLQRPKRNEFVRGINFRKFSFKEKKLTKFINELNSIIDNNNLEEKKKKSENIIIYFSRNFQTVSKITFENSKTGEERTAFAQTVGQFNAGAFEAFNDARANFFVKNFESIYPDISASTFKRKNINFRILVKRNFLAPGVSLEENDCASQSFGRKEGSATAIGRRLEEMLRDAGTREARQLLKQGPFKTVEELANESRILTSDNIRNTMKKELKQAFVANGRSVKKEYLQFQNQLSLKNIKQSVNDIGAFTKTIQWEQILVIALASVASRYGVDDVLSEDFIKKQLAERISKHFTSERVMRDLMGKLGTEELQLFALFLSSALLEIEIKKSTDTLTPEQEAAQRELDLIRAGSEANLRFQQIQERIEAREAAEQRRGRRRSTNDEDNSSRRSDGDEEPGPLDDFLATLGVVADRVEDTFGTPEQMRRLFIEEPETLDSFLATLGDVADRVEDTFGTPEQIRQQFEEESGSINDFITTLENLGVDIENAFSGIAESVENPVEVGAGGEPTIEQVAEDLDVEVPTDEPVGGQQGQQSKEGQDRRRLIQLSLNRSTVSEFRDEIVDLIIGLSNCDRQNNAELYTKMIMFLVDEIGGPILEYFDEWSEYINSWDIKNLDFCNLPDLNFPGKGSLRGIGPLFPLNISIPDIRFADLFRYIFGLILAILFGLLLKLIQAIIAAILSLIPDFIFDFEPCEFANALRDFSQVLRGIICQVMNGEPNPLDALADIGCKVLDAQTSNEVNNRDLVNFFKDSCKRGLLPGPSLVELLQGDASDDTLARAEEYFRTVGNENLANEIRTRPQVLSEAGGAIGSVIGIGDLLDTLDDFEPTFPVPGLSANGFVSNLDLCSDPEASDILDQLCTDPNPELRKQLLDILEQQRESDREDAAKLLRYLTDPSAFSKEVEEQMPNIAHPSLIIPGLIRDKQFDQVPVVKNKPSFALGRDEGELLNTNTKAIKSNLETLDSCVSSYGSSLIRRSKNYKRKIRNRNRKIARRKLLRLPAPPKYKTKVQIDLSSDDKEAIIGRAFNNLLFNPQEMPESAQEEVNAIIESLQPEIAQSNQVSFEIGKEYFRKATLEPLLADSAKQDDASDKILISDLFNNNDLNLFRSFVSSGELVEQIIGQSTSELDLSVLSIKMKKIGQAILEKSLENKLRNAKIDLGENLEDLLDDGDEELDLEEEQEADVDPTEDEAPELRELPEVKVSFSQAAAEALLPASETNEEIIIDNYLNGSLKQERTYKRFIEGLPQYSEFYLSKTDPELASMEETIKTAIRAIVLEEAHSRSSLFEDRDEPFAINDTSTAVYCPSLLEYKIEERINEEFEDFKVKFLNSFISGYNALSYCLYELAKLNGDLKALSEIIGSRATPKKIMRLKIQEAIDSINRGFGGGEPQIKTSMIEGKESKSIIYNFKTPHFFSSVLTDADFEAFLSKSAKNSQKNMFLSSNLSFEVVLREDSEHYDAIQSLNLEQINQQATSENVNNLFITRKSYLKRETFDSLRSGEAILLDYDDVFSVDFSPSEDKRPLMASIFNFAIPGDDFESFIFENFTVKPVYRVFTTYLTKEDAEATRITVVDGSLSRSENRSLGIFKKQKINSIYSATNNRIFNSSIINGEQIEGAGFALVELASYQGPLLDAQTYTEFEDSNLIKRFMQSEESSSSAQDFKKNASINILLSCLVPYSNIINEATSYILGSLVKEEDLPEDFEEGNPPPKLQGPRGEPGRKLLSPIKRHIKTTKFVVESTLTNE